MNEMDYLDFDIVVSTTDTPESLLRRERIVHFFDDVGIMLYVFDIEPVCTVSPLTHLKPGYYGADQHFAKILKSAEKKGGGQRYYLF